MKRAIADIFAAIIAAVFFIMAATAVVGAFKLFVWVLAY